MQKVEWGEGRGVALLASWKHLQRKASSRIQGHWRRPDRGPLQSDSGVPANPGGPREEPPACTPGG